MDLKESFNLLKHYVERENFKGFDPYDFLNSKYGFDKLLGEKFNFVFTQINKRMPINSRHLMGIKKDHSPHGLALFLMGYCALFQMDPSDKLKDIINNLLGLLIEMRSPEYENYCWGLHFPYVSRVIHSAKLAPNIVDTAFVYKAIYKYVELFNDRNANEILESICQFITNDLPRIETRQDLCFSYTPEKKDICYNANALGVEILAMNYKLTNNTTYFKLASKGIAFTIKNQKEDGHWNYRLYDDGSEKQQIDFHQGYIINSILNYMEFTGDECDALKQSVAKAAQFYKKKQFLNTGQSLWRYPVIWPTDIHNQAVGIATFLNLEKYSEKYPIFAKKVTDWTIKNMQDRKGHFYYRKYPLFINKISYMRWGQAWMFYAISKLLYWEYSNNNFFQPVMYHKKERRKSDYGARRKNM